LMLFMFTAIGLPSNALVTSINILSPLQFFPLYNLTRTKLMRDDEMILYYRLSCLYEITSQDSVFCIQIFRLLFVGLDSFLHVLPSLLAKSSRHISNRLRSSLVNLKDSISVISEYD